MTSDLEGFFGGTLAAVKFEKEKDTVEGKVLNVELRQQSEFETGRLLTWPDGRPKMQAIIQLQVADETEEDDGIRALYVRGYMQQAITAALRKTRSKAPAIGGVLKVTWISTDKPEQKGHNGAKRYDAEYWAPGTKVPF